MNSENNQLKGERSKKKEKKTWVIPAISQIEARKIRQEEVELYYRMMEDPELFKLMGESGTDM